MTHLRSLLTGILLTVAVLAPSQQAAGGEPCNPAIDVKCDAPSATAANGPAGVHVGAANVVGENSVEVPGVPACANCEYMVSPSCQSDDAGELAACGNATSCSEPGQMRMRVYRREPPSTDWVLIGTVCRGPSDPGDVPDISQLVREEALKLFPTAAPSYQPVSGAIVNLPTLFASGQPKRYTSNSFDLSGFTIVVSATPRWEWTFEPGITKSFDQPGGAYPDDSVAHTYRDTGDYAVHLTTSWTAEYTVNGEGPFPVPGPPITQDADLEVTVREARSVLVDE